MPETAPATTEPPKLPYRLKPEILRAIRAGLVLERDAEGKSPTVALTEAAAVKHADVLEPIEPPRARSAKRGD